MAPNNRTCSWHPTLWEKYFTNVIWIHWTILKVILVSACQLEILVGCHHQKYFSIDPIGKQIIFLRNLYLIEPKMCMNNHFMVYIFILFLFFFGSEVQVVLHLMILIWICIKTMILTEACLNRWCNVREW